MEEFIKRKKDEFEKMRNEKNKNIVNILRQLSEFCDNVIVESAKSDVDGYSHLIQSVLSLRKFAQENEKIYVKDIADTALLQNLIDVYNNEQSVKEKIINDEDYVKNPNKKRNLGERPEGLAKVRQMKKELDS